MQYWHGQSCAVDRRYLGRWLMVRILPTTLGRKTAYLPHWPFLVGRLSDLYPVPS